MRTSYIPRGLSVKDQIVVDECGMPGRYQLYQNVLKRPSSELGSPVQQAHALNSRLLYIVRFDLYKHGLPRAASILGDITMSFHSHGFLYS